MFNVVLRDVWARQGHPASGMCQLQWPRDWSEWVWPRLHPRNRPGLFHIAVPSADPRQWSRSAPLPPWGFPSPERRAQPHPCARGKPVEDWPLGSSEYSLTSLSLLGFLLFHTFSFGSKQMRSTFSSHKGLVLYVFICFGWTIMGSLQSLKRCPPIVSVISYLTWMEGVCPSWPRRFHDSEAVLGRPWWHKEESQRLEPQAAPTRKEIKRTEEVFWKGALRKVIFLLAIFQVSRVSKWHSCCVICSSGSLPWSGGHTSLDNSVLGVEVPCLMANGTASKWRWLGVKDSDFEDFKFWSLQWVPYSPWASGSSSVKQSKQ